MSTKKSDQHAMRTKRADAKKGFSNPFFVTLQTIDANTGLAGITSHAANQPIKYLEPFQGNGSWIRATPSTNTHAIIQYQSDTQTPEIMRYIEFNHAARVDSYRKGHEPYRNLQPGAIDIHSLGYAGAYYGERPYSQTRGGVVSDWRDQDNLEHGAFAPVHRRILLHHENNSFSDEEAFGVVSRPFGEAGRFYPNTLNQDFAKAWEIRMKPYSAYPNDMFWYRVGNVIDDNGLEELSSTTGFPLRLKNIWYTGLPPVPLETAVEIDVAGNASLSLPFTALSGLDISIPGGSFSGSSALGWSTSTALGTSVFSGTTYENTALISLQMKNLLTQFDITELGDVKFRGPLTNFEQLATGEILLSSGLEGFIWKLNVSPSGALTITQQNGGTSKFEISETGSFEFTNALTKISAQAAGEIEISNAAGLFRMEASGHVDVDGKAQGVSVGSGGLEPFVLGQKLQKILNKVFDIYAALIVPTPGGNSFKPLNGETMLALKGETAAMLSQFNKVS